MRKRLRKMIMLALLIAAAAMFPTKAQAQFGGDETTTIGASLNDNGKMINDNYYSIDGRKLNGEPVQKGVYVRNGRKVVVK